MTTVKKALDGNRRLEGRRLVYYHKAADKNYWEDIWAPYATAEYYKPFQSGKLFTFEQIFTRHLPQKGRILEAGCGTAQFVAALNARKYNCLGVDYAFRAMKIANQFAGPLPLVCGDITALGITENALDAVISLGVVEHRISGPEPFLEEMFRILKPKGVMLISIPYFNPLRRWRAKRGAYQDNINGLDFYQYAFTFEEFNEILAKAGFDVEKKYSYGYQNTLTQELHWLKKTPEFARKLVLRISKHIPYINSEIGHMLMIVARKRAS